jgi:hypothetical protein
MTDEIRIRMKGCGSATLFGVPIKKRGTLQYILGGGGALFQNGTNLAQILKYVDRCELKNKTKKTIFLIVHYTAIPIDFYYQQCACE